MSAGKRVVLCSPPWSYASLSGRAEAGSLRRDVSGQGVLPTLGLHYVATSLELAGHRAWVEEGYRADIDALVVRVLARRPDVVGIYALTPLWERTKVLLRRLRAELPAGARIAVGGPHTGLRRDALAAECPEIDRAFVGPAEAEFTAWVGGEPVGPGSRAARHPPGWARRLAARIDWRGGYLPNVMFAGTPPFATSVTTMGCSLGCAFCNVPLSLGGRLRRDSDEILEELDHLEREAGVRTVSFMDDQPVFAFPGREGEELLLAMARRRKKLRWTAYLGRFDLDEARFRLMRDAGAWRILLFAESGVPRIIEYVKGRPVALDDIERTVRGLRRAGIETAVRFQFGFPGETWDDGLETVRFAASLPADFASFIRAMLYPGSRMAAELDAKGLVSPDQSRWSYYGRPYTPDAMTAQEQERLCQLGVRRFYGRPRTIARFVRRSASPGGLARTLRLARRVLVDGIE